MESVSPSTGSSAVEASLVRAAEGDTEKSVTLLKKALKSDKDLVATLLPQPGQSGGLDILA